MLRRYVAAIPTLWLLEKRPAIASADTLAVARGLIGRDGLTVVRERLEGFTWIFEVR